MSKLPQTIKPVNRHLLIVPFFQEKKTTSGVLLPEDYKPEDNRYITAAVLDTAKDCSVDFKKVVKKDYAKDFNEIVVERAMVEEIEVKEKKYYLVLENYVVGILRDVDAWAED